MLNTVFITNKSELNVVDLSDKDWFDTQIQAVQIACTNSILIVLTPNEEVFMMTLAPIEEPASILLLKDNYKLLVTQVKIDACNQISASSSGICFAV